MPYTRDSEVPDHVPKAKRSRWRAIWNRVYEETGSEERAFRAANAILGQENEMNPKALIQARVAFLEQLLEQAGKRLSKATLEKLEAAIATLKELMAQDEVTEEAAEQSLVPQDAPLLQAMVTGETIEGTYEQKLRAINRAVSESDMFPAAWKYAEWTWPDRVLVWAAIYQTDGKYNHVYYLADYTEENGSYTFSNVRIADIKEVITIIDEAVSQSQGKQAKDTGPSDLAQSLADVRPTTTLLERTGATPLLLQILPGSVRVQGKTSDGRYILSGIATHGNVENLNDPPLVYPTENWAADVPDLQAQIRQGKAIGALGHPTERVQDKDGNWHEVAREPKWEEHAIRFTDLQQDGDYFPITAEIIGGSDAGRNLQANIDAGVIPDLSTVAIGTVKLQEWNGKKNVAVVQKEGFKWLRIADVVLNGASPGATVTSVTLQSLQIDGASPGSAKTAGLQDKTLEPEEEKTMNLEELYRLLEQAVAKGEDITKLQAQITEAISAQLEQATAEEKGEKTKWALQQMTKVADIIRGPDDKNKPEPQKQDKGDDAMMAMLQTLQKQVEGLGQTSALSEDDKAAIAQAKVLAEEREAEKRIQARDKKITEFVGTLTEGESPAIPKQFAQSAEVFLRNICQREDEVEGKKTALLESLAPVIGWHTENQSKGFYFKEHHPDGTKIGKIQSLDEGVDELIQSAKERGIIKARPTQTYPFSYKGRDFNDIETSLRFMARTLVEEHPIVGQMYLQMRNRELRTLDQAVDLMSREGARHLLQAGSGGAVIGDFVAPVPYLLPMMFDIYPQLIPVATFGTLQPLAHSTGRVYTWTTKDEDGNALDDATAFTGSYTVNNTDGAQIKYINGDITETDVATGTKEVGWQSTIKVMRHLTADFGVSYADIMVRECSNLIAREWNYNFLQNALEGQTGGNENYGVLLPEGDWANAYDAVQWRDYIIQYVRKVRGRIWKNRFTTSMFVFGDSDAIDRLVNASGSGLLREGGSTGTIQEGINIEGQLKTGETLIKVGWWDQLPGCQNKLLFAGKGDMWYKTGYVVAPFLGLFVSEVVTDVDYMKKKQGLQSEMADLMVDGKYFATLTIQPTTAGTPI